MAGQEALEVLPRLVIPGDELEVDYARSGGPGGQNVNKVESKVLLRFSVEESRALDEADKARVRERLGSRLTTRGEIVVQASSHRERERNVQDARERLAGLLRKALARSPVRRPTRPTRGSQKRRLESKRQRGEKKRARRPPES